MPGESFVTKLEKQGKETVQGGITPGSWAITVSIATIAESIHEIGDNNSWWHCDSTGEGGGAYSDVVIAVPAGEACYMKEIIVEG